MLTNVTHQPPGSGATSVLWQLSSPGNPYALSLIGCSLGGSVDMTAVPDPTLQPMVVIVGCTPPDPTHGVSRVYQLHPRRS